MYHDERSAQMESRLFTQFQWNNLWGIVAVQGPLVQDKVAPLKLIQSGARTWREEEMALREEI